jgi:hypothetical protein
MSNALTGLLFGIGLGGWVYAMMMRQNGGQIQSSVIVATAAGLVGFFVIYTTLGLIFK